MLNFGRILSVLALFSVPLTFANAQSASLNCVATAVPAIVRSEGLAEQLGDISLQCSGGIPGPLSTQIALFMSPAINVTNRVGPNGAADVILTADTGAGPASTGAVAVVSGTSVSFNGVTFTVPASGNVTLRITNLRAAVNQVGLAPGYPIRVLMTSNAFAVPVPLLTVGVTARGLLVSSAETQIPCTGSPLPAAITFAGFLASNSAAASTRVTEGFAAAFQPRTGLADTGTRIVFRYSGFPSGARVFVPDLVAGSTAAQPTSIGDMGLPVSGGQYVPGSGSLLLVRVLNPDANGAGGTLAVTVPESGPAITLDSVSEVPLTGGSGIAVYEVVDATAGVRENAQVPTFVALGRYTGLDSVQPGQTVSFAPVSDVAIASATAPIPRFVAETPETDCAVNGDCNAPYVPSFVADRQSLSYTAPSGSGYRVDYVILKNGSGGFLKWTASVSYQSGAGWLVVSPATGGNAATVRIDAHAGNLAPGTYQATVTFDGGRAGKLSLPVTFEITAAPVPPKTEPTPGTGSEETPKNPAGPQIDLVANAATYAEGPLAPGSLAMIKGARLNGTGVSVTVDGIPAKLLYVSDGQINLQLPAELANRSAAQLAVAVDGLQAAAKALVLQPVAPGIFAGGVVNEDGTMNSAQTPAAVGTRLQVLATGLPGSAAEGAITAKIHDREITAPVSAGAVAGVPGVEQVTFTIPADLPAMTTEVLVCGATAANPAQRVCSTPVKVTLRQ